MMRVYILTFFVAQIIKHKARVYFHGEAENSSADTVSADITHLAGLYWPFGKQRLFPFFFFFFFFFLGGGGGLGGGQGCFCPI